VTQYRFVFVVEQGLGHAVHGMNLHRVLEREPGIDATVLAVKPGATAGVPPLPLVANWSVQTSWAARALLRQELRAGDVDAVFIHTQVAALFARGVMRSVPTIISLDATPLNFDTMAGAYDHARHAAPFEWVKRQINRRALIGAAGIVTWSRWAATSVTDDYGVPAERVQAVYPGVELAALEVGERRQHCGPIRILFVGGDFTRKGGADLVQAVAALGGTAVLDLVTSAPEVVVPHGAPIRIHRQVRPNSPELSQLYADADIFALPSRGDCTPLAIAEAMASGLPIVATTVGSIPDMVRHGHNGLLVPPGRADQLTDALSVLVADGPMRSRFGGASRVLAAQEHDMVTNWRHIFDLMRAASRPRPARSVSAASVASLLR
jgi:glycosyltransferase involved in cell wall biosynthesis